MQDDNGWWDDNGWHDNSWDDNGYNDNANGDNGNWDNGNGDNGNWDNGNGDNGNWDNGNGDNGNGDDGCHTLVEPEDGFFNVTWEKEKGIVENPEWYDGTGLREDSPFEDFQAYLRGKQNHSKIPLPCGACPEGQVHAQDGSCKAVWSKDATVFYVYRAQGEDEYAPTNVNVANIAGLMWYLHNEVLLPVCPPPQQVRKFDITRIKRFKVAVMNPKKIKHKFSAFVAYDRGRCSTPDCMAWFKQDGYTVGCQNVADDRINGFTYPKPIWYSLPGPCPLSDYDVKPEGCEADEPGGMCDAPTGAADCTYSLDDAGEISIAELEGIDDINEFCAQGGGEYDKGIDGGYKLDFWNGGRDKIRNKARIKAVKDLFRSRYPDMPSHFPEPECEWG